MEEVERAALRDPSIIMRNKLKQIICSWAFLSSLLVILTQVVKGLRFTAEGEMLCMNKDREFVEAGGCVYIFSNKHHLYWAEMILTYLNNLVMVIFFMSIRIHVVTEEFFTEYSAAQSVIRTFHNHKRTRAAPPPSQSEYEGCDLSLSVCPHGDESSSSRGSTTRTTV